MSRTRNLSVTSPILYHSTVIVSGMQPTQHCYCLFSLWLLQNPELNHCGCIQVHIKDETKTAKKKLADGWEKLATNNTKSSEWCCVVSFGRRLGEISDKQHQINWVMLCGKFCYLDYEASGSHKKIEISQRVKKRSGICVKLWSCENVGKVYLWENGAFNFSSDAKGSCTVINVQMLSLWRIIGKVW